MPDLYEAQLDGIPLEIEMIDDEIERAIVRHEYPYKHGALLEDMGQKARVVRFRCYFWDDGADHATYDRHEELLAHLESLAVFELVHPKYGPMRGGIESIHLHHDDRDRTAEIDLTFVQGLIEDTDDTAHEDVESSVEEAYAASIEEQKLEFGDDLTTALGPEAGSILGVELDPELGIVEQMSGISTTARNYLKTVEGYVSTLEGTLNAVANPANGLVSILNYGTNLPGRVIGSVARCMERYARLADGLRSAPARFVDNLGLALDGLSAVSGRFAKTTTIGGAAHIALQTAYCYKEDEDRRAERKRAEGKPVFDALGNYTAPQFSAVDTQPMTVRDLESSLATVRGRLQAAVNLARQSTSLKQQALSLQTHVNTIKLEREKITRVRLDNTLPLHLVCLRYGLPYSAAERLLTINEIRNPNEVSGEVAIYVS
jgi:prophage DNA circulation protein